MSFSIFWWDVLSKNRQWTGIDVSFHWKQQVFCLKQMSLFVTNWPMINWQIEYQRFRWVMASKALGTWTACLLIKIWVQTITFLVNSPGFVTLSTKLSWYAGFITDFKCILRVNCSNDHETVALTFLWLCVNMPWWFTRHTTWSRWDSITRFWIVQTLTLKVFRFWFHNHLWQFLCLATHVL